MNFKWIWLCFDIMKCNTNDRNREGTADDFSLIIESAALKLEMILHLYHRPGGRTLLE